MAFELQHLLTAYRKAKREVFHQNLHLSIRFFIEYEKDLISNLEKLMVQLNRGKKRYIQKDLRAHQYFTIVKSINYRNDSKDDMIVSNAIKRWDILKDRVETIDFRVIPDLDAEIHIISSLWIDFYGKYLEYELSSNCYGSRVVNVNSSINHFKPYVHEYRLWQQNGINVIRENFRNKKNVIAITADFNSFYHHIDPDFLLSLNEQYNTSLNPGISEDGVFINYVMHAILKKWSVSVYSDISDEFKLQFRNANHVGIPIGLSASKIIANLVLAKFDKKVEEELSPAYYGRYVDDIFIVLNDNTQLTTRDKIWNYISKRINGLNLKNNGIVIYKDEYTEGSSLEFNTKKEKIFILDKTGGEEIIKEIEEELKKNSSEWRFIPEAENDLEKLSEDVTFSDGNHKDGINSLRKANTISIKRLKFANYLNKLEEIVRTHPEYFWKAEVKKLIYFVKTFAISPDVIYDYTQYIPRILQLVIYTENYKLYWELSEMLRNSVSSLRSVKNSLFHKQELDKLDEYFNIIIKTSIFSGLKIKN
ncbi:RNA-directed DNA polymerase [Sphingobacterium multivorum]|uniref:RNA-directed DNA polymerase n=1 Tax=Sphingobacterium TaxID=28453 RepID=UPI00191ABDB1|nr:RNA-directed DNA polymerase [Sphingobacterium multivorum]QQT61209.1 RNA-directed DNA polymerase [Sphingobacterium multivorum]